MKKELSEQDWLHRLIGDWVYELSTADDSDHPEATATGTETIRSIGDTWLLVENKGKGSDGSTSHSVTMLGFEPGQSRFTGAVAGTSVPVLFVYNGELSEDKTSLVLETEGPAMTEGRATDRYRDMMHVIDESHRESISLVLGGDGQWREFMRSRYRRTEVVR